MHIGIEFQMLCDNQRTKNLARDKWLIGIAKE
jgi:hypothetical protein